MFSKVFKLNRSVQLSNTCKRFFDLHEYQSKDIMRKFNIRVQRGDIALTPEEAKKVAIPLDPTGGLILKAQVHAGGRGKGTSINLFSKLFALFLMHLSLTLRFSDFSPYLFSI